MPTWILFSGGHLGAAARWTEGRTTFEFTIRGNQLTIAQDGKRLAQTMVTGPLAKRMSKLSGMKNVKWGEGIFGRFQGRKIFGAVKAD